jgi:hypothetical protein
MIGRICNMNKLILSAAYITHATGCKHPRLSFKKWSTYFTKYSLFLYLILIQMQNTESHTSRVEAGKDTSAVIPASRKRRRKGNPVVSGETVMLGRVLRDSEHRQIALQITDPSSGQRGCPKTKGKAIFQQKEGKSNIWSRAPKGCPTPRHSSSSFSCSIVYVINYQIP